MRHWAAQYIGKPYRPGARGPDAYDCWGLLVDVYHSRYQIPLPSLPGISVASALTISREIDLAATEEWEEVSHPFDGCAVAMSQSKVYHHVGVFIWSNGHKVLHAMDHCNVVIESVKRLKLRGFKKMAYFKHRLWPT